MGKEIVLVAMLVLVRSALASNDCHLKEASYNLLSENEKITLESEGVILSMSFDEAKVFISKRLLDSCASRIYLQSVFEGMLFGNKNESFEEVFSDNAEFHDVLCKAVNASANAWPDGSRHELMAEVSDREIKGIDDCVKEKIEEDGYFPVDYISENVFLSPGVGFLDYLEERVGANSDSTVSNSSLMLFVLKNGGRLVDQEVKKEVLSRSVVDAGAAISKNETVRMAENLLDSCKKVTLQDARQFLQEVFDY